MGNLNFFASLGRAYLFLTFLTVLFGCDEGHDKALRSSASADKPGAQEVVSFSYAKRIKIETKKSGYQVEIFSDKDTLTYLLLPNKQVGEDSGGDVIGIPINRFACLSSTHVGMLTALDQRRLIIGVSGYDHVYDQEVKTGVSEGDISELAIHGKVNIERVLERSPDILMSNGLSSLDPEKKRLLKQAGIPVVLNLDWKENHPLGKAEWVKFIGLLTGKFQQARSLFQKTRQAYNDLGNKVSEKNQPSVICNLNRKGSWFVPGGNSYMARFLEDAGADYPWKENEQSGGLKTSLEEVYQKGLNADYWLNPGRASSLAEIAAKDDRLTKIEAFQKGKVYNNTKKMREGGGNDYWESGVVRPDLHLADLVKIFHPEVLPKHRLIYYEKLE